MCKKAFEISLIDIRTTVTCFALLAIGGCRDNSSVSSEVTTTDSLSAVEFPILIEGGSKTVYRFGKMTPRGLKYFFDTVETQGKELAFPDSVRRTILSPISMSGQERDSVPGIIAISLPGFWEETIFGKIDREGLLHINYIREIQLEPESRSAPTAGNWSGVFRNDSTTVRLVADLSKTKDGDHLAGKGRLFLLVSDKLIEEREVILVFENDSANRSRK